MGEITFEYGKQMALKLRPDLDELLHEYEYEITAGTPAGQLHQYLDTYNWDDGFSIPYLIVCHPNCELATAVNAFWLSGAAVYFEGDFKNEDVSPYQQNWKDFVIFITEHILNHNYKAALIEFPSRWKLSNARLLYRKNHGWEEADGIPDIFYGLGSPWEEIESAPEEELNSAGWDSITACFEQLYPGQTSPKHYGTLISWSLGGNDPLEGISVYDGGAYWHFVTYGLSELYEKEEEDKDISGYGMEFTLKLKKGSCEDEEAEIMGICGILQTIARITFTQGEIFQPFEYLYTGQTQGMDTQMKSAITGFITIPEPKAEGMDTPNGHVDFVEFIGVTDAELKRVIDKEITVKELYGRLGSDVTDYNRMSLY